MVVCRATPAELFFRRNTQRDEVPPCKGGRGCDITTQTDRKMCTACRYHKCLRVGMTPCLVLNDEDKKIRFKKSQQKKIQEMNIFRNELAEASTFKDITEEQVEVKYEAERHDDDEHEEAHNYTLAFLNAQQYKYEYENNITHKRSDESFDPGLATNSIKSEFSHSEKILEQKNFFEKSYYNCSQADTHQKLRHLLELSHKAAICAKLKDTDFPKIFESKLFDYSEDEKEYSHENFKKSQEQQDLIIRMLENRKRKSVIVSGPYCKNPFPVSFDEKYHN